jgi:hypothetical protein
VKALKVAGLRVPDDATEDESKLADAALARQIAVMMEDVHPDFAPHVMKAATSIRAEICKPIPTKLEHAGADGEPLAIRIDITGSKR